MPISDDELNVTFPPGQTITWPDVVDERSEDNVRVGFGFTVISLVVDQPEPEPVVCVKVTVAAVAVDILLEPVKTPVEELIVATLPSLGEILHVPV